MKKTFISEDGEGFKKRQIVYESEDDFPDTLVDLYMHLEELEENNIKKGKKLKYYREKAIKYGIKRQLIQRKAGKRMV